MPRPPAETVQVTFRVPRAWLERAAAIAKADATPGLALSRTDAFRMAIARGFAALEDEQKRKR